MNPSFIKFDLIINNKLPSPYQIETLKKGKEEGEEKRD